MRSKLLSMEIKNLGCIGNEGLKVDLDNILCLVGDNNSGKSTVLRAYELAVGTVRYDATKDRCNYSDNDTVIEISVHIPDGVENIAEKWKEVNGDLRIVKSKWTWDITGNSTRETYDPEQKDYSPHGNAAGLDNVFASRLPKPLRISALEGPHSEFNELLRLIVEPISDRLKNSLEDAESEISKALKIFNVEAEKPVADEAKKIENYNKDISNSHASIFPNLEIDLSIGIGEFNFDPVKALIQGSNLNVKEFGQSVVWQQQGTGSQRALFWSLLQVRSKLQSLNEFKNDHQKNIITAEKAIKKLERERDRAKTEKTIESKDADIKLKLQEIEELKEMDLEAEWKNKEGEVLLPGYMLLIDEPEIALHPNGIRAASNFLYDLAKDKSWQVMLSTHSPLFVNPFEDNTTIVRLSRDYNSPTPKTYRSDTISFSEEEKDQLTLLNTYDQNLAEMFFGQYPIIVEGDTEFASFQKVMSMDLNEYPLATRPLIIRARGKFTINPIIKMLTHFKVNFSVLHDSDYPTNKAGDNNSVWKANEQILDNILEARKQGLKVIHRISIYTFEIEHGDIDISEDGNVKIPSSKNKPFIMYDRIGKDDSLRESVNDILQELIDEKSTEEPFRTDLDSTFESWRKHNNIKDSRFIKN